MVHRKSHLATQWLPFCKLKGGGNGTFEMLHIARYITSFSFGSKRLSKLVSSLSSDGTLSPKLKAFVGINRANLPNWNLFR